jgi:hypothetical protein
MDYLSIKEAEQFTGLSIRTIQKKYNKLQTNVREGARIYFADKNNRRRANYSTKFLESIKVETNEHERTQTNVREPKRSDLSNDLQSEYITHLKEQVKDQNKQINDLHEEFKAFQQIELQAMERIKEQNHIIHQLQEISEERAKKLLSYQNKQNTFIVNEVEEVEEPTEIIEEPEPIKEPSTFSEFLNNSRRV